jgi:TonB family protein
MMTLDLSPGAWRHGMQPAFQVTLRPTPGETQLTAEKGLAASSRPAPAAASVRDVAFREQSGLTAKLAQAGSTIPTPVRYFRNNEVDVPAIPISRAPLILPEHAYFSRLHGSVKARIFISEEGAVESVHILEVKPVSGIFEEAAMEALRQVVYAPALIAQQPVKAEKVIQVIFNPYEESAAR